MSNKMRRCSETATNPLQIRLLHSEVLKEILCVAESIVIHKASQVLSIHPSTMSSMYTSIHPLLHPSFHEGGHPSLPPWGHPTENKSFCEVPKSRANRPSSLRTLEGHSYVADSIVIHKVPQVLSIHPSTMSSMYTSIHP